MKEIMINNSVMKCCVCDNKNTGEFITIKDKKYHLCCIEELQKRIDKTINSIETTIQIIGQQASRDEEEDKYILDRLESFIKTLKGE